MLKLQKMTPKSDLKRVFNRKGGGGVLKIFPTGPIFQIVKKACFFMSRKVYKSAHFLVENTELHRKNPKKPISRRPIVSHSNLSKSQNLDFFDFLGIFRDFGRFLTHFFPNVPIRNTNKHQDTSRMSLYRNTCEIPCHQDTPFFMIL